MTFEDIKQELESGYSEWGWNGFIDEIVDDYFVFEQLVCRMETTLKRHELSVSQCLLENARSSFRLGLLIGLLIDLPLDKKR